MKLDIGCVVWGQSYTRLMLEYGLPSLMAAGNLPDWAYRSKTILQLYTTAADAAVIQQHQNYKAMSQLIPVHFHTLWANDDAQRHPEHFARLNQGHHLGILNARNRQAAFMYMAPDHVFATGCFKELEKHLQSGAELIMALTPRVDMACQNKLQSYIQNDILTLKPHAAADLFLQYVAPIAKAQFWDAEAFNVWCSHVYRYTGLGQVTAQGFHLHPLLMCNPPPFEPKVQSTLDGDFLDYYDPIRDKIGIPQGNELFILSLTSTANNVQSNAQFAGNFSLTYRQLLLDRFYRTFTRPIHRWFFQHRFQFTGSQSPLRFNPACQQAIDAMQAFWEVESAWEKNHQEHLITLFNHHEALWPHLPDILFQGCREYYLSALNAKEQAP